MENTIARPSDPYSPLWVQWRQQNPHVRLGVGADTVDGDDDAADDADEGAEGDDDGIMGKPDLEKNKPDNRHPAEILADKGKKKDGEGDDDKKKADDKTKDDKAKNKDGRPEGIPEKFWDAEKKVVKTDEMAKAYATLEAAHGKLKAQKGGDVPENAEDYFKDGFKKPEGTDRVKDIDVDDPALKAAAAAAKKVGMPKGMLQAFAPEFLMAINDFLPEARQPVNIEEEMEKLGNGGDALVSGLKTWIDGMVASGKTTPARAERLYKLGIDAEGVLALKDLRADLGLPQIPVDIGSNNSMPSAEELYAAKRDPRYREDPAFRKKIDAQFEEVFGDAPAGSSMSGIGMPPQKSGASAVKTRR